MISRRNLLAGSAASCALAACTTVGAGTVKSHSGLTALPSFVDVIDPAVSAYLRVDATLDVIGSGYGWSEGPTWDRARSRLYFTDVPGNTAYRWSRDGGLSVFKRPSGTARVEGFREPGANGLYYGRNDQLLICNHGKRRVERLDLATGALSPVASLFDGKRFNSPNDVVEARDGTLYFTDPPYGLEGLNASPLKEMPFNGVYRVNTNGDVTCLVKDMTLPNGIALSPDERFLYVSQSDRSRPLIRRLALDAQGRVSGDEIFFDGAALAAAGGKGSHDGMAVTTDGTLFATGPGGVLIISASGQLLGRILTWKATANCAFGEDGSTLFITAHDQLMRLETEARGVQWA